MKNKKQKRCKATTLNGQRCEKNAVINGLCTVHLKMQISNVQGKTIETKKFKKQK